MDVIKFYSINSKCDIKIEPIFWSLLCPPQLPLWWCGRRFIAKSRQRSMVSWLILMHFYDATYNIKASPSLSHEAWASKHRRMVWFLVRYPYYSLAVLFFWLLALSFPFLSEQTKAKKFCQRVGECVRVYRIAYINKNFIASLPKNYKIYCLCITMNWQGKVLDDDVFFFSFC